MRYNSSVNIHLIKVYIERDCVRIVKIKYIVEFWDEMWCDLRKLITWWKFWYIELLVSHESLNYPLFRSILGSSVILASKVTEVQRLRKIKKNIGIMLLISFILQFQSVRHVTGFPRLTNWLWIKLRVQTINP